MEKQRLTLEKIDCVKHDMRETDVSDDMTTDRGK
jgi:hypothetical protein